MQILKANHRKELSIKAADSIRNVMGSWPFVFGFIFIMLCWAYLNSIILKHHPLDPYPYVFLNLLLSTLAGMQGAILLIAARRADAILQAVIQHIKANTDKIALETDQIDKSLLENTKLTQQVHDLATIIHDHLGIDTSDKKD